MFTERLAGLPGLSSLNYDAARQSGVLASAVNPHAGSPISTYNIYLRSQIETFIGGINFLPTLQLHMDESDSRSVLPWRHPAQIALPLGHLQQWEEDTVRWIDPVMSTCYFTINQGDRFVAVTTELLVALNKASQADQTAQVRAFDKMTEADVLVKIINPSRSREILDYSKEATIISRVTYHPNLAQVFDFTYLPKEMSQGRWQLGKSEFLPVIISEYVPGVTASQAVDQYAKYFPENESFNAPIHIYGRAYVISEIIKQSAAGLDHLHSYQIIHNDVTGENIIVSLDPDGSLIAKIIDYGSMNSDTDKRHFTGLSVSHASPETLYQYYVVGSGTPTNREVDQHSLAMTAFEFLTHGAVKDPFSAPESTPDNEWAVLIWNELLREGRNAHLTSDQVLLDVPGLHPQVMQVLRKATSYRPQDRYSSCSEFAHELELALLAAQSKRLIKAVTVAQSRHFGLESKCREWAENLVNLDRYQIAQLMVTSDQSLLLELDEQLRIIDLGKETGMSHTELLERITKNILAKYMVSVDKPRIKFIQEANQNLRILHEFTTQISRTLPRRDQTLPAVDLNPIPSAELIEA